MRSISVVGCAAAVICLGFAGISASAQTAVGIITVCYFAPACSYTTAIGLTPPVDAPAFEFTNTSDSDIAGAKFTIHAMTGLTQDQFVIGKIPAHKSVIVVPGYSNDRKVHSAGSFFTYTGTPFDTSDSGPSANTIKFSFTGKIGTVSVTSGVIVTGKTTGPSNDGTVSHLNFLGGPANTDGPCNDCFGPKQIAILTKP